MSFNKYNTRNSGRFNTSNQFTPAGESNFGGNMGPPRTLQPVQQSFDKPLNQPTVNHNQNYNTFETSNLAPPPPPPSDVAAQQPDVEMKTETNAEGTDDARPAWMKSKLQGVKKISNKERRRRQNENLRRLLTPKSALMVLNEIVPGVQNFAAHFRNLAAHKSAAEHRLRITGLGSLPIQEKQFRVEPVTSAGYYRANPESFCADLTLQGSVYKGYGDNRVTARNAAAEQAVRDLILKKMTRVLVTEASEGTAGGAEEAGAVEGAEGAEETLPMIQLASFALHKLFAEWEYEGHKVPQLRTPNVSMSDTESAEPAPSAAPPTPKPPKKRELPANASSVHPCMLLAHMRPQLEYRELAAEGDRPQNMLFTMGIDVDGTTYVGKACNKREARKAAAKAACGAVFGVRFDSPPH